MNVERRLAPSQPTAEPQADSVCGAAPRTHEEATSPANRSASPARSRPPRGSGVDEGAPALSANAVPASWAELLVGGATSPSSSMSPRDCGDKAALTCRERSAYDELRRFVDRDVWDFLGFGSKELSPALMALGPLDACELSHVMKQLDTDRLLGPALGALGDHERRALLEVLAAKGYLRAAGGSTATRPGEPPPRPELFFNDPGLPAPLREAIHHDAVNAKATYGREFGAYLERFQRAAQAAGTIDELRALGPPQSPQVFSQPGLVRGSAQEAQWIDAYERVPLPPPPERAFRAVSDRVSELTGRPRAGAAWLSLGLEAADLGKKGVLGGRLEAGRPGLIEREVVEHDGVATPIGKVSVDRDEGGLRSVRGEVAGMGMSASREKEVGLKVGVQKAGGVAAYTWVNEDRAELELGAQAGARLGQTRVEVHVGLGARGLTGAEAAQSVRTPGFFWAPEREQGLRWDQLSPERRTLYERCAWTAEAWDRGLPPR